MSLNNRIKSFFWKIDDSNRGAIHSESFKPFENHPLNFEDPRVNEAVGYHNKKWDHNEIAVKVDNGLVEPQYAYVIEGLRTINGVSIRTRNNLPSPLPTLKAKLFNGCQKLDKAVVIDGSMGINYFHFLSDVLHKIYLFEEHISIDCPLLIGKQVYDKPFVQFLIKETDLRKYNWTPIEEPMLVKELYVARPLPYKKEYWAKTKQLFIQNNQPINENKALFVNRTGTRRISNFEAIKPILNEFHIEEFDPGKLNMREQAEVFNGATHVIGIHGAGLANVFFCNYERTKVLELCSNNRIGTQYYWLCTALGINWNMLLGGVAEADQSFELDPAEFRKALEKLFAS